MAAADSGEMDTTLRCSKCGIDKCSDDFHSRKDRPKGRVSRCKSCANENERSVLRKIQKTRHHRQQVEEGATRTCAECGECKPVVKFGAYTTRCMVCNGRRQHGKVTNRFRLLVFAARTRKLSCSLTLEQYASLVEGASCAYCGFELPLSGSGLDRIDNSKGYSIENCVPCCSVCNMARGPNFTADEMKRLGAVIRQIRLERKELHSAGGGSGCTNTEG